jgi:hypothetical protein
MDATTTAMRGARVGRWAGRLLAAATLMLVMLGAMAGAASASDSPPIVVPNLTKEEFIEGCLSGNGINIVTEYPKTNTVMCEHDDGSYNICNFNPPVNCVSGGIAPDPDETGTHGTIGGGTASGGTTPTVGRPRIAKPGAGQVLDDEGR